MPDSRPVARGLVALALLGPAAVVVGSLATKARSPPKPSEKRVIGGDAVAAENRVRHPLDPLGPEEIRLAVATLRDVQKLPESYKLAAIGSRWPWRLSERA
jgi:Cu2+-containing amine oxidase